MKSCMEGPPAQTKTLLARLTSLAVSVERHGCLLASEYLALIFLSILPSHLLHFYLLHGALSWAPFSSDIWVPGFSGYQSVQDFYVSSVACLPARRYRCGHTPALAEFSWGTQMEVTIKLSLLLSSHMSGRASVGNTIESLESCRSGRVWGPKTT